MDADTGDIKSLELISAIGFDGSHRGGLRVHPDRQHIIYPLGCTVVVEELPGSSGSGAGRQQFLSGHTNSVTCIAISKSGRFIASGQVTHMGFKADIIVWVAGEDSRYSEYARFSLHKVKVTSVAFSPSEKYLVSLGGEDDGAVVFWSLAKKEPVCGAPAQLPASGVTECLAYANVDDRLFFTAGENTLRVWEVDVEQRKLTPKEVGTGQLKRNVKCIAVQEDDQMFFAGTSTGDILGVNVPGRIFQELGPEKGKFSLGVTTLELLKASAPAPVRKPRNSKTEPDEPDFESTGTQFLVGAGDGTVQLMERVLKKEGRKSVAVYIKTNKRKQLAGGVTSLALRGAGHQFFAGTTKSQIYRFAYADFTHELLNTCHSSAINDVAFPLMCDNGKYYGTSELFATCGFEEIRIWHVGTLKELLRITVPNMTCNVLDFSRDGRSIVSGWQDSRIRSFYPESGKLMFEIVDAHKQGVTAIAVTSDSQRVISGGGEGQVRVWQINQGNTPKGKVFVTKLIETMKEHKGAVSSISITKNDRKCVSASLDGTCIIWDLERFVRNQVMFANTLFKCVAWREPDECQLLTSGTDRKVAYWEAFDGSLIRELLASRAGAVNTLHTTSDGMQFATAGDDKLVKVWKYKEGAVTHVGVGHSSAVQRLRICPNNKLLVSVGDDGSILLWRFPAAAPQ